MNGITRWAERRRAIASWTAARPRLTRWLIIGVLGPTIGIGLGVATTAVTNPTNPKLVAVSDATHLKWSAEGKGETVYVRASDGSTEVTFYFDPEPGSDLYYQVNNTSSIKVTPDQRTVRINLDADKENHVEFSTSPNGASSFANITVWVLRKDFPWRPRTLNSTNVKYVELVPKGPSAPAGELPLYGGYVRILGSYDKPPRTPTVDVQFALFAKQDGLYQLVGQPIPRTFSPHKENTWIAEVVIPKDRRLVGSYKLVPFRKNGQRLEYADADQDIEISIPVPGQAQPPKILDVAKQPPDRTNQGTVTGLKPRAVWYLNETGIHVTGTAEVHEQDRPYSRVALQQLAANDQWVDVDSLNSDIHATTSAWSIKVDLGKPGDCVFRAVTVQGCELVALSDPVTVQIRTTGPTVVGYDPADRTLAPDANSITIKFDPDRPLDRNSAPATKNYLIKKNAAPDEYENNTDQPTEVALNASKNEVTLTFAKLPSGWHNVTVLGDLTDIYGNKLNSPPNEPTQGSPEHFRIAKRVVPEVPEAAPGMPSTRAPYVTFGEYTKPREVPDGFNPSDHVETRVARLYYYRDAHRVAQIINRNVRSYNGAAVDAARQLADKARGTADDLTDQRRATERKAIEAARRTREAERELQAAEQTLATAEREAYGAARDLQQYALAIGPKPDEQQQKEIDKRKAVLDAAQNVAQREEERIATLRQQVQDLRGREFEATEQMNGLGAKEDRARQEQFRREVAAAHEDPDTYAPGVPGSDDPVRQVSVSVIGEGLIQLRGPIKGINVIRQMINQIDSPVGQVRVNVHTVQINGEHGNRMEQVADRIQKHLDHSRFLTTQSAEILRRAIVKVASRRAAAAMDPEAAGSQDVRDQRYLYAFFGRDFIDELRAMDSEFLHTGNKLLSLHSMDTTSLSSALFLMALANNSTRQQILAEFQGMLAAELPAAEQSYYEAGSYSSPRCTREGWQPKEKFQLFAGNARFESLRGFFDAQADIPDTTMTPIQREFIRLAQIFKARLITEMELNQRTMERAVIEDRLGDRLKELRDAREKETEAENALAEARNEAEIVRQEVYANATEILAEVVAVQRSVAEYIAKTELNIQYSDLRTKATVGATWSLEGQLIQIEPYQERNDIRRVRAKDPEKEATLRKGFDLAFENAKRAMSALESFQFTGRNKKALEELQTRMEALETARALEPDKDIAEADFIAIELFRRILRQLEAVVTSYATPIQQAVDKVIASLARREADFSAIFSQWIALRPDLMALIDKYRDPARRQTLHQLVSRVDTGFRGLLRAGIKVDRAREQAEESRRPLDHKKFLDMLVDDLEDKFIELLEGTRAHTANIDNYIKRLATALESDFNTQFYYPSFRGVREASRYWDVNLGQIETTGILANNRAFAKVAPQATLEFDLPKRDILIAEAMNGAKAMVDDFGALVNDPSFLALAALGSGQSPASQMGGASGGLGSVRSVLPGTDSATAEKLLSQSGPGQAKLGSALEALIPDPAIYKFETGTGFEIRPVIQPDGQAVVFHLNYMYTTNVREPVRADEKHLGRVKQHFIDTDVQLSNYELREVSRYMVALKASRTARGVPLLEDVPIAGVLFRPLPQQESSLQENLILAQATIYPTLFDLMGMRWAPAVADLDPLRLSNEEFVVRNRHRALQNRVYDYSSSKVDEFLRIPEADRRPDLYRTQETIPALHPNGYQGPGLDLRDSQMQEGYQPQRAYPQQQFIPGESPEGSPLLPRRGRSEIPEGTIIERYPLDGNASKAEELSLPSEPQSRRPNASIRVR